MIDEYDMEIGYGKLGHNADLVTRDGFPCCNKCGSVELTMNTTSMSHGIVYTQSGVIVEFTCNSCRAELTLALCNQDVGKPQLTASARWVTKRLPPKPLTSLQELQSYSLTGQSHKMKKKLLWHGGYLP